MPIPSEILSVERPKGTVVQHSGNKYYVVKRTSRYDNGRRIPVNLGIVGEIVNGQFVPKIKTLDGIDVDVKDFGNVCLCNQCGKEVLSELMQTFSVSDAQRIYAYAMLKVIYGDITARDLSMHYETSFVSEFYPGISCSRKTVSEYMDRLGRHVNMINSFMKKRLDNVDKNAYVVVDGMLKNNNSETNSFSEFSRKGKIKNSQDISILYAYDYKNKEPLACSVYPGNMLDKTSFTDFTEKFDIKRGVLIGDKGFELTDSKRKEIVQLKDLKYLIPIKRNLKCIETNHLQEYDDILDLADSAILCKKVKVSDKLFYYSFLDLYLQGSEGQGFVSRAKGKITKKNTIEDILKKYEAKKDSFGTIIFESNMDISCEDAYEMYAYRWSIEEVFNYYKNVLDIDNVRVQDDTRLYGSEFINFIAAVITCKVKNYILQKGLASKYSFKQIMLYLSKIKRCRSISAPASWHTVVALKYISDLFDSLNLTV